MHVGDAGAGLGRRCRAGRAGRPRVLSDNSTRLISISLVRALGGLGLLSRDAVSEMIRTVVLLSIKYCPINSSVKLAQRLRIA